MQCNYNYTEPVKHTLAGRAAAVTGLVRSVHVLVQSKPMVRTLLTLRYGCERHMLDVWQQSSHVLAVAHDRLFVQHFLSASERIFYICLVHNVYLYRWARP